MWLWALRGRRRRQWCVRSQAGRTIAWKETRRLRPVLVRSVQKAPRIHEPWTFVREYGVRKSEVSNSKFRLRFRCRTWDAQIPLSSSHESMQACEHVSRTAERETQRPHSVGMGVGAWVWVWVWL